MGSESDSGISNIGFIPSLPREEPWNDPKNPKILTFHPTFEEFKDFQAYIQYMESRNAHLGGIAKIVPPKAWKPRREGYDNLDDLVIRTPIRQDARQTANRGSYEVRNYDYETMTWGELKQYAYNQDMDVFSTTMEETERNFWKQLTINPPIYGADNSGSLFDEDQTVWNIARLPSILDDIVDEDGNEIKVPGVNTPYLYFGMWRAFFGWHTEDMDLYSINLIHDGAAKFWYSVPPQHGRRFERIAEATFPDMYKQCHAFLRHKSIMISHTVLKSSGVPFNRIMQESGDIIITFPFGYHAGFNCGLNIAESTNFATQRWIEYGKYCSICNCQEENVRIDMGIFVKKYQPERWEAWQNGTERGRHPEEDKGLKNRPPTSGPAAEMLARGKRRRNAGGAFAASGGKKMMSSFVEDPPSPAADTGLTQRKNTESSSSGDSGRLDALIRKKKPKRRALDSDEEEIGEAVAEVDVEPTQCQHDWDHTYAAGQNYYRPTCFLPTGLEMPLLPPTNLSASPYRHLFPCSSLSDTKFSSPGYFQDLQAHEVDAPVRTTLESSRLPHYQVSLPPAV